MHSILAVCSTPARSSMPPEAGRPAVELAAGDWRVIVRPSVGGSIARFEHRDGTPVFLPVSDLGRGAVDTGGCFPMLPFANRVRDCRFILDGRERVLAPNLPDQRLVHGYGWLAQWAVTAADTRSLDLIHEHHGGGWPSRYRAEQRIEVEPRGLRITLRVTNTGDAAMPCGLGLHPYFSLTPASTLEADAGKATGVGGDGFPVQLACMASVLHALAAGGHLPASIYLSGVQGAVTLALSGGKKVFVQTSHEFDEIVVFVPPSRQFVCIEPATHPVGALDTIAPGIARNIAILQPGDALSGSVFFEPFGYA